MLILFALGATVLILGLSLFGGTRTGLWWGWPIAMFLLPWRLYTRVGALTIDLTLVAEALFLAGMLMKPEKQGMKYRWLATDSFVILLMLSLTVTLIKFKLFGGSSVVHLLRYWLLPYYIGKHYLHTPADLPTAMKGLCIAAG